MTENGADEIPSRSASSGLLREFPNREDHVMIENLLTKGVECANRFLFQNFGIAKDVNSTDGARIQFENGDILSFRPSYNTPEFRCYSKSDSFIPAQNNNKKAWEQLAKLGSKKIKASPSETGQSTNHETRTKFKNIELMNESAANQSGMDIIVISTTSRYQEHYWQNRLESTKGVITNSDAVIITVHEDWPGGAGNGLGTLYALVKAQEKGLQLFAIDIMDRLKKGASIGLYHTAGKGTRLAPLPGSETNNKSGVKLPGLVTLGNEILPITILEAVIKQTSVYASSRKKRVSVFWGDQIFVPSVKVEYQPNHHADILCQLGPMPDRSQWERLGLEKYGLIAVDAEGHATQVEKIDFDTAEKLIADQIISAEKGIGISIGSFSISYELAQFLLAEFGKELSSKTGKLNSDPHIWMPLTLDLNTYIDMMERKGQSIDQARDHYQRMASFKERFQKKYSCSEILGPVNTGQSSYWWDYGTMKSFIANTTKLLNNDEEGAAIRDFFGIHHNLVSTAVGKELNMDDNSRLIASRVNRGSIKNSLLINVHVDDLVVENCVLIGVACPKMSGQSCLIYNVFADEKLDFKPNSVRSDCHIPGNQSYSMVTRTDKDGGQDWNTKLQENQISYEELHRLNSQVDPVLAEGERQKKFRNVVHGIFC